ATRWEAGTGGRGNRHSAGAERPICVRSLRGSAGVAAATRGWTRPRERQSVRRLDSRRSAVRDDLHARSPLDATDVQRLLWLGTDHLRRGGAVASLAAQSERDAFQPEDAATPTRARRGSEALQDRSGEAARSIGEAVSAARNESVQPDHGLPADAPADARPLRVVLRFPEHDRIPRCELPLAAG